MVAGTEIRLANKQENSIEFATGDCCGVDPHFTYSRGLLPYPPQYIDGRRHPRSPPGQARPVDVSLVVLSLIRKPGFCRLTPAHLLGAGWRAHGRTTIRNPLRRACRSSRLNCSKHIDSQSVSIAGVSLGTSRRWLEEWMINAMSLHKLSSPFYVLGLTRQWFITRRKLKAVRNGTELT